jgi:hypothetical protein
MLRVFSGSSPSTSSIPPSFVLGEHSRTLAHAEVAYSQSILYHDPPLLPHDVVAATLEAVLVGEVPEYDPNGVLIGLALHDNDCEFVEMCAVRVGEGTNDATLRDSAALAIGHLARRFGRIGEEARAFVSRAADHPESDGRARDARTDIQRFAPT